MRSGPVNAISQLEIREINVYDLIYKHLFLFAMHRNIDIRLLRTFAVVAETGGMTSAGRVLNLTQAAINQQIQRLEELFQRRFIERSRRKLRLTPDGERMLAHARRLVAMNDDVWGTMTAPEFEGELKIGVPHDIVRTLMPPILRDFANTWPRVQISLVPGTSLVLLEALEGGAVDLTLTTEIGCQPHGETLLADRLVWVGAHDGRAYARDPLPISVAGASRLFRQAATEALERAGRDWRLVCEDLNMLVFYATLEADQTVAPMLIFTVPDSLQVLGAEYGLPKLPAFNINLYAPKAGVDALASEMASYVKDQVVSRYRRTG